MRSITGSAGKTSVKEMLASILKLDGPTIWSKANIDPVFNIASTILRCTFKTKYLVLELGVEHIGEMDFYLKLVTPDLGIITNIFPTHTLFFKNIEGVLLEKSKLVRATKLAVLNSNDTLLKSLGKNLKSKVFWFKGDSDPNVQNSNTVIKAAKVLGISDDKIRTGLGNYINPVHRFNIFQHKSGAIIFDDSYNSNPNAVITTLKVFDKKYKRKMKIAVLGDMLELGDLGESEHIRIGNELKKYRFSVVIGVGELSKFILKTLDDKSVQKYHVLDQSEVDGILYKHLNKNSAVLIKGSRSIGLDKLVDRLV